MYPEFPAPITILYKKYPELELFTGDVNLHFKQEERRQRLILALLFAYWMIKL